MQQNNTQSLANGHILVTRADHIARITFNKPEKRNAMSLDMWQGLHSALDGLAADDNVRVVILNGAGGKAFVSGADISEFETQRSSAESVNNYNAISEAADRALYHFPKPTIAEIDGYCVGGGMGLAVACDFRICSEGSRLGITAGRLGLGYGLNGVHKLVELAGPSVAARILYTAELFAAEEAKAMGLVTQVVPSNELIATVTALAGRITMNAPLTIRAAKAAIRAIGGSEDAPSREAVEERVAECFASEDYAEGRRAFAEKRQPIFKGA
jgi:enoyl-CoA hydratase